MRSDALRRVGSAADVVYGDSQHKLQNNKLQLKTLPRPAPLPLPGSPLVTYARTMCNRHTATVVTLKTYSSPHNDGGA